MRDSTQEATAAAPNAAPGRRGRRARSTGATDAAGRATRRGRSRQGRGTRPPKPEVSLGDAALRAVEALSNEVSAGQIREYLGREFSMQVRPNHLGMALQRHRRAGPLREDKGRWAVTTGNSSEDQGEP